MTCDGTTAVRGAPTVILRRETSLFAEHLIAAILLTVTAL